MLKCAAGWQGAQTRSDFRETGDARQHLPPIGRRARGRCAPGPRNPGARWRAGKLPPRLGISESKPARPYRGGAASLQSGNSRGPRAPATEFPLRGSARTPPTSDERETPLEPALPSRKQEVSRSVVRWSGTLPRRACEAARSQGRCQCCGCPAAVWRVRLQPCLCRPQQLATDGAAGGPGTKEMFGDPMCNSDGKARLLGLQGASYRERAVCVSEARTIPGTQSRGWTGKNEITVVWSLCSNL